MPIDSKECFAALTEDGQLWEIYQAAQTGGGGITSINGDTTAAQLISGTAPITASTAAGTTTISTSMNTARLLGRTTAGVGVAEEISVGTGLSLSAGTLSSTVTAGVTSVTGTSPIASSGGTTPAISIADAAADGTTKGAAAFNANDFESASGVISLDYTNGQSASASNKGFLTSADWTTFNNKTGGSVGAVDNAVLRADVGTGIVQNSNIVIDDVATATQDNVAIVNASSATNSALVLTPKGTGALIAQKPNGAASGGNARGANAVDWQMVRSGATQVASGPQSVICGGYNNTAAVAACFVGAGYNNTATSGLTNTPSVVCGGYNNTASSQASFVGGGSNNTSSSEFTVVVGGQSNNATSPACFVGGGGANTANADGATVCAGGSRFGGSAHSGNTSNVRFAAILGGSRGLADRFGMQAHASGAFASGITSGVGDAQRARFVLRCKTTTNAAVEMALDGGTTYLGIPSGKVIACTINISGVKSDGSAVAHYVRQYAVKNVGGTSSEVYAPVTIGTDNAAGTVIALSANNADDTLRIAVTGIAAETWRWVASVDAVEIAYGT